MKKTTKSILSILLALVMLITMLPTNTYAATSKSYKAYMGIQTNTKLWIFRNSYDDATYGHGTAAFKGLNSVSGTKVTKYDGTFKDATIKGNGTYTVTLTNPELMDESHLSLLFISTNIPMSKKVKVTNVKVKFDGKLKKTFKTAFLDPDSKKYVKILCLNEWQPKVKDCFSYPMPFKKCEITFKISGLK